MPTFRISAPDGKTYEVTGPEGSTAEDALARVRSMVVATPTPEKGVGEQLTDAIKDVPRQVGLTARYGLEGLGNAVGVLSDPIGATINMATGSNLKPAGKLAADVADQIGLPKPQNARERIVGDVATTMATGGGIMGGANRLAQAAAGPVAQNALAALGQNAGMQTLSNASAGGAGGYVRETGGDGAAQFAASLAAGVGAPMAANKLMQVGQSASNAVRRATTPASAANQQIDVQITQALQQGGVDFGQLAPAVQNSIRQDVAAAMQTNGILSPDAVRRLADYRMVGATPTRGSLTLDPATITQERNLAKLGINSKDAAAQELGRVQNANNRTLINNLNDLGAGTAESQYDAGGRILQALGNTDQAARGAIGAAYSRARDSAGRSAPLDPSAFTQRAGDLLNQANAESFLPAGIRDTMNRIAQGQIPLNVEIAEQLKSNIGRIQRGATDGNTRYALGLVRQALEDTPLQQSAQNVGQESIDAFNSARALNRSYMQQVEGTPALQALRDGVQPDKFVQTFIVGNGGRANVADLQALRTAVENDPGALQAVRNQIAAHLKSQALGGAADEVGNVSQSSFNKALRQIGDEKLGMFFTPDEVAQLRAVGRVASYEQFQPKGSAVNNSNTAAAGLSAILDRIANSPLLSKIPFGNQLAGPVQNISVGIQSRNALNVPNALNQPMRNSPRNRLMLSPAAFLGTNDEKQ
ncbi:hypothetical protein [Herbaspirillum sp. CAH-3]|uniref:hypothetical protein n=1 Tax=Herbaspirillum sp. CAH-3 TaxID=2605746 RepID=UPI0012ACAD6B|nr:hypothetical protein [Herbaspirillum sp. CAH-3]MRT30819.1 hypothetical protein [Herbaspirillum sp. CAH-3]